MTITGTLLSAGAALMLAWACVVPALAIEPQPDAAADNGALAAPQIDKIRKYFKTAKPAVEPIEVSRLEATLGAGVPADIPTEPLPGALLVELPAGVKYEYFLLGNDLVVVNAETRTVVAIVRNAA